MKQNNRASVREILEEIPTARLDEMLQTELQKEPPDENVVRIILRILKDRESGCPVEITPGIEKAWKTYQHDAAKLDQKYERSGWIRRWAPKVASIAVVVGLLFFALPQAAGARDLWGLLTRWTDSIFEFFNPNAYNNSDEYVFQTDNPGLQEVYDAVTELGVTDPVVPMWLPEGYELTECKGKTTSKISGLSAEFVAGNNSMVFKVDIYDVDISHKYYKDVASVEAREIEGTIHNIMRNDDRWVVIWTKDNWECSLSIDCQEDTLYKILRSIYVMEDG